MSLDAHHKLETTEHVEIEFDLAGPGSRFCAMLIDGLLMGLLMIVLWVLVALVFVPIHLWTDEFDRAFGGWALLVIVVGMFLIQTFYHVAFEAWMRGQTPGKKKLGLRAIREDGLGMSFIDVLIRNLLRPVDFLPVFYGLGGLVSFFHPMHKRLGDLAAGTIVIKDGEPDYRATTDGNRAEMHLDVPLAAGSALTPAEQQLVARYLTRRPELTLQARQAMAERLARPLHERHGGHWDSAEQYLERLFAGRQDEP